MARKKSQKPVAPASEQVGAFTAAQELRVGDVIHTAEGDRLVVKNVGASAKGELVRARRVARPAKATTLVVYRALPVNRRIVQAHPPGKPGQIKVVRVQDNSNFMRGMVLEARHVSGQTFELVGGLPRWRGKWGLPGKVDLWRPPVEKKLTPAELKTQLRAKYGREGELI